MTTNFEKMGSWEIQKAAFLIQEAAKLGMRVDGYGEVNVNQNSGYTYLWLEDYQFTLYMEINCELERKDIYVSWYNPEDGNEIEERLTNFRDITDIYKWVDILNKEESERA
jgi:hypothetical protein